MTARLIDLKQKRLILASASPRRKELLGHLGAAFDIVIPDIEEQRRDGEDPLAYSQRNAIEKACAVLVKVPDPQSTIVIGADTIVVCEGQVLEKPKDIAHAEDMLRMLSGRQHEVLTALALAEGIPGAQPKLYQHIVKTDVYFKTLTDSEIRYYIHTGEPLDKAGSYGIQGIGGFMVERIHGSYSNVVGLPLVELTALLRQIL